MRISKSRAVTRAVASLELLLVRGRYKTLGYVLGYVLGWRELSESLARLT